MRKLAMVCLSFASAAAVGVYLGTGLWLALTGAALAAAGLLLFLLRPSRRSKAAMLVCIGFGAGAVYCTAYAAMVLQPVKEYDGTTAVLTAEICRTPVQTDTGLQAVGRVDFDGRTQNVLLFFRDGTELRLGDRVTAEFSLRDSMQGDDEERFFYYQAQDIVLIGTQQGSVQITRSQTLPVRLWPMAAAEKLRNVIQSSFSKDTAGFMTALLTGDRTGMSYQERNALSRSGIAHTVSISGMHVSILMSMVLLLSGKRRRLAALLGCPVLLCFMAMTGFSPSVVRAGVMQMFLLLAPILRRENDGVTSLSVSLLLILLVNPWAIAGMSLQLSYGAVAGIFLLTGRICRAMQSPAPIKRAAARSPLFRRLWNFAAATVSTTLGAIFFTTPLAALYTSSVPVLSVVTNLLVLPVISVCFMAGLLVCAVGFFWGAAAKVLAFPVGLLVKYILCVARGVSAIPFAALDLQRPYLLFWLCFAYFLVGVFVLLRARRRPIVLTCCLILSLVCSVLFSALDSGRGTCSVTALDVGQGQCIVAQCGDFTAMIDCGGSRDDAAGEAAACFLEQSGAVKLDVLILTHFDNDHTGGIEQLFSRVRVGRLYLPDTEDEEGNRARVLELADAYGIPTDSVSADLRITAGDASLTVFAPVSAADDNESGLCVLFSVGTFDALVTGDLSTSGEYRLLSMKSLPDLEVLVAGHHGSKYSTSQTLLEQTCPEVVLISVGRNSYGHPAEETLARISAAGAVIYRTDECGDITVRR